MTAVDNKGNTTDTPLVTGIAVQLPPETEPNDSFEQAQTLDNDGIIVGTIQDGDSGTVWTSPPYGLLPNAAGLYKIEDFYKITCCSTWYETDILGDIWIHYGISLTVDFSGSASLTPDLDVYVLDQSGISGWSTKDNIGLNDYTEEVLISFDKWLIYNSSSGHWYLPDPGSSWVGKTLYAGIRAWKVPTRANYIIHYH